MSVHTDRARKMQLLARVEQAREVRCRVMLGEAETVLSLARSRVEDAEATALRRCEERHATLRGTYDRLLGAQNAGTIHALRITEQLLFEQEATARRARTAAEAAAGEALAACQAARDTLRLVSLRSERRGQLADTLRREAALSAQRAEEETTADELMDRIGSIR